MRNTAVNPFFVRRSKLAAKRAVISEKRSFRAACASAIANTRNRTEIVFSTPPGLEEVRATLDDSVVQRLYSAYQLNCLGMVSESAALFDELIRDGSPGKLSPAVASSVIASFAAPLLQQVIYRTDAKFDPATTLKLMGENHSTTRIEGAVRFLQSCNQVGTLHYNNLMSAMMTGGYNSVLRVCDQLYDAMGQVKVAPNARTYELVVQALCLTARVKEAEHIVNFLRAKAPEAITIELLNTLFLGYREVRDFTSADALWREITDRRAPLPNCQTADFYLRTILDLAYTPVAGLQVTSTLHEVEKKRIPLLMKEMESLGIPGNHLTPPVTYEVDAAIKHYVISNKNFYQAGRAVKIFDAMDYRRRHGWLHDVPEMEPFVVKEKPPMGKMEMAKAQIYFPTPQQFRHETPPLAEHTHLENLTETYEEAVIKFGKERDPIHERSRNWVNEVPETRYDNLYGLFRPNVIKQGISQHRRRLRDPATSPTESQRRDEMLISAAASGGRRLKKRLEQSRTHQQ